MARPDFQEHRRPNDQGSAFQGGPDGASPPIDSVVPSRSPSDTGQRLHVPRNVADPREVAMEDPASDSAGGAALPRRSIAADIEDTQGVHVPVHREGESLQRDTDQSSVSEPPSDESTLEVAAKPPDASHTDDARTGGAVPVETDGGRVDRDVDLPEDPDEVDEDIDETEIDINESTEDPETVEEYRSKYARIEPERERDLGEEIARMREDAKEKTREEFRHQGIEEPDKKRKAFADAWKKRACADSAFRDARDELYRGYTGVADAVAQFYGSVGFNAEEQRDLHLVAHKALFEAAMQFDPHRARNASFSALAYASVRGQVVREINSDRYLHVPVGVLGQYRQVMAFHDELVQINVVNRRAGMPSPDEVAAKVNAELDLKVPVTAAVVRGFLDGSFDGRTRSSIVPSGGLDEREGWYGEDGDQSTEGSHEDPLLTSTDQRWAIQVVGEDEIVDPTDIAEVVVGKVSDDAQIRNLLRKAGLNEREAYAVFARFWGRETNGTIGAALAERAGLDHPYTAQNASLIIIDGIQKLQFAATLPYNAPAVVYESGSTAATKQRNLRDLTAILDESRGSVSVDAIAERLGVDPRTVGRYLDEIRTKRSTSPASDTQGDATPDMQSPDSADVSPESNAQPSIPGHRALLTDERDALGVHFKGPGSKAVQLLFNGASLGEIGRELWPTQDPGVSAHLAKNSVKKVQRTTKTKAPHVSVVESVRPDGTVQFSLQVPEEE